MNNYLYGFIILLVIPLASSNGTFKCGDCTKENTKLCQIEKDTGASCYKSKISPRDVKKYTPEKAPMSHDMNLCISPGMDIDPEAEICCAWSPQTGCQLVLHLDHAGEHCSTCRLKNPEYPNLEICPCVTINRSGCGQLYSGSVKVLIGMVVAIYLLRRIFDKFF